jgi:hypothetical protein
MDENDLLKLRIENIERRNRESAILNNIAYVQEFQSSLVVTQNLDDLTNMGQLINEENHSVEQSEYLMEQQVLSSLLQLVLLPATAKNIMQDLAYQYDNSEVAYKYIINNVKNIQQELSTRKNSTDRDLIDLINKSVKPNREKTRRSGRPAGIIVSGSGMVELPKYIKFDKHLLSINDLKNKNKIVVKFVSSPNTMASQFKGTPIISNNLRDLILDTVQDKYNKKLFDMLGPNDRRLFKKLVKVLKIHTVDIDNSEDAEEEKQFQILLGEWEAGNNSPNIIATLKKHIRLAILDKRISKSSGLELLLDLNNNT